MTPLSRLLTPAQGPRWAPGNIRYRPLSVGNATRADGRDPPRACGTDPAKAGRWRGANPVPAAAGPPRLREASSSPQHCTKAASARWRERWSGENTPGQRGLPRSPPPAQLSPKPFPFPANSCAKLFLEYFFSSSYFLFLSLFDSIQYFSNSDGSVALPPWGCSGRTRVHLRVTEPLPQPPPNPSPAPHFKKKAQRDLNPSFATRSPRL